MAGATNLGKYIISPSKTWFSTQNLLGREVQKVINFAQLYFYEKFVTFIKWNLLVPYHVSWVLFLSHCLYKFFKLWCSSQFPGITWNTQLFKIFFTKSYVCKGRDCKNWSYLIWIQLHQFLQTGSANICLHESKWGKHGIRD